MLVGLVLAPAILHVGAGGAFANLAAALAKSKPGDRIEVAEGAYPRTAVRIGIPNLTLVAKGKVVLDGAGFDYSGIGTTPRAILQIDADGTTIAGFDLKGAHNATHNGAGIRINAAHRTTVRDCQIYGNDMGIMSNGVRGDATAGAGQLFERCRIHHNGDAGEPGQNHNLYLGGTDATLRFCEIDHSLTGHNLKSRAHLLRVEHCWIHDAANRELDLVDAWDTERPGSDATIVGSVLTKDPNCTGNRGTIHFGQEKGRRAGRLLLRHCTVDSPFSTPVISLTGEATSAELSDCIVRGRLPAGIPVKTGGPSPAFRWAGGGRWVPTKERFAGAG